MKTIIFLLLFLIVITACAKTGVDDKTITGAEEKQGYPENSTADHGVDIFGTGSLTELPPLPK